MHLDALEIDSHQFLEIRAADFASARNKNYTYRAVSFPIRFCWPFFLTAKIMASSGRLRLFFFGGGFVIFVSLLRTKFEKKNTLNRNDSLDCFTQTLKVKMHKIHLQITSSYFSRVLTGKLRLFFGLPWPRHQRVDLVGLPSAPSQANLDRGSGWRLKSGQAVDMSHEKKHSYPIASMYGIFTYIYQKIKPKVDKYSIHGWYGYFPWNTGFDNRDSYIGLVKIPILPGSIIPYISETTRVSFIAHIW